MANTKSAPDPLTTLEAMWRGSITRLGQFFKDYKEYGAQTKTVLRGTSGKYRDALDDLETELLDVKWLLEQDLRSVRARRDAVRKTIKAPTPAKRKLDAVTGDKATNYSQQKPPKRQKSDDDQQGLGASKIQERDFAEKAPDKQPKNIVPEQSGGPGSSVVGAASKITDKNIGSDEKRPENVSGSAATISEAESSNKHPEQQAKEHEKTAATNDMAPSEAPLSAGANDMGFESIFGSPAPEGNGNNEFDLNIDMTGDLAADDSQVEPSGGSNNIVEDPSSLNSLLPGLESYANATNDDFSMLNAAQNGDFETSLQAQPNPDSTTFDLPSLDDTNEFDAFLNSGGFPASAASEQKKDDPFNDDSMLNLGEIEDDWFN